MSGSSHPESGAPVERPRYGSQPLPPYSYVPGHGPHPVSDPRGHMYRHAAEWPAPLDPADWAASAAYLGAVDLFNHGYYWEAHEMWESLWRAAGRGGAMGIWLKALIKLAAAGVKAREGNRVGVDRHARRTLELIGELRAVLRAGETAYCGMRLDGVEQAARGLIDGAATFSSPQPALLLPWSLTLRDP